MFYNTLKWTKIMASRQAWISNKNVCVLYRVTTAAGLLREPQPSGLPCNSQHICSHLLKWIYTQELAAFRHLFQPESHGSSSSRVGNEWEWAGLRMGGGEMTICMWEPKNPSLTSDRAFDVRLCERNKSFLQKLKLNFKRQHFVL